MRHKKLARASRVRRASKRNPRITTTYEIVTEESAEEGEAEDRGWLDKVGHSCTPDAEDRKDGFNAVDLAIRFLQGEGAIHKSSSHFHKGVWYSTDEDIDYSSGEHETRSFHLKGFTEKEERQIFFSYMRAMRTWNPATGKVWGKVWEE